MSSGEKLKVFLELLQVFTDRRPNKMIINFMAYIFNYKIQKRRQSRRLLKKNKYFYYCIIISRAPPEAKIALILLRCPSVNIYIHES